MDNGFDLQSKSTMNAITFSPEEDIDVAFCKLSATVKTMIINSGCKFNILQDACIETALSPKKCFPSKIVPKIGAQNSVENLFTMLTKAYLWTFLDTRMMEAVVTASMIPAAMESLKNFKEAYFDLKLSEVVPFVPIIPLKPSHVLIEEQLDVNPRDFTIHQLHKHRYFLESETDATLTCFTIKLGSLFISWLIHVRHAYKAYIALSKKTSQAAANCVFCIPVVQKWAKLPVILYGQDVDQIGPIEEPLKDHLREDPFCLPEGFQWTWLDNDDSVEKVKWEKINKWCTQHPRYDRTHFVGISSKLAKCSFGCVPYCISVGGCVFISPCAELHTTSHFYIDNQLSLIIGELLKEMLNKTKKKGISQVLLITIAPFIIKPLARLSTWFYPITNSLLLHKDTDSPDVPITIGLRRLCFQV